MQLYGNTISQDEINKVMRHMINTSNRNGSFNKMKLRAYIEREMGIPARVQPRRYNGQFGYIIHPSDELADRFIQMARRTGRSMKVGRSGVKTLWRWMPNS